ncbi:SH3-like domain-containing protein [Mycobacteroides immunogenum]|uniref:nitrile hydratase n=1 Tax=Mycobacteroides immunogenum TaxID=83262 RepID=A0A7V8LJ99_9MYCO|nr:SH3-like domain-containing protein [Mycobacteroides immunogenum]AMT71202.1 nitrile hydratase [Mycobacteroides immunogenum]ANO04309.1 nitrile hydratase [Mycobacteroides immunogenum]KIU38467.1 nitrile hydratase [Mycobacteroides immunogenum]KPG02412.1 nitrile hydratase [Mycobacteroides immunogenum]KPG02429.1 nitrile hydratase [Mycobacteroides immunogenum]
MSTSRERANRIALVRRLRSSFEDIPEAPYGLPNNRIEAYLKTQHDVGGELDAPIEWIEKKDENWEHNTYIMCELLGLRGIWVSEERRRLHNVDIGRAMYLGFPYYGRWLMSVPRVLIDKHIMTLTEITAKFNTVKKRVANLKPGELLEPRPREILSGDDIPRNRHHIHAVGVGDPQIYTGQAEAASFNVGDRVVVREWQALFYTRTQEYLRGVTGEIATVAYESPAAEDEGFDYEAINSPRPEWFYIVRFKMVDLWPEYSGAEFDTLQTELPERWLMPA